MKSVLEKCEIADFEYLSEVLESYMSFTDDKKRKLLLDEYKLSGSETSKIELLGVIEEQIRYFGSSDIAYLWRNIFGEEAGVDPVEIVEDVCERLKVKIKKGGSLEVKLERLVMSVVEKELLSKPPEELKEALLKVSDGDPRVEDFIGHFSRRGKAAALPLLFHILGPKLTYTVIQAIIVSLIQGIVGKEAAKLLIRELAKRNPWLQALGPVIWAITGAWLAFDLQSPAFRKTAPVCLHLGIVAMRNGAEEEGEISSAGEL